jgi:ankyrin repeat protein
VSLLCNATSHQDICHVGGRYHTALQAAARNGHEEIVEILIANGADVNCYGGRNGTALNAAVAYGHGSIVSKLLQAGAQHVSSKAMLTAASRGLDGVVRVLMEHGADVNIRYPGRVTHHSTGLAHYKMYGKLPRVLYSKPDQADPKCTFSLLDIAIKSGNIKLVETLIEAGATSDRPADIIERQRKEMLSSSTP